VHLAELLDPADDGIELGHQPLELLVAHRDPREPGDMPRLFVRHRHDAGRIAGRSCTFKRSPIGRPPMCARRFLMAVFVLTLVAVAAGFALFQWGGNILLKQATPKGHFEAARAGGGPDYSLGDSWISNPRLKPLGENDPARWLPDGVTHGVPG